MVRAELGALEPAGSGTATRALAAMSAAIATMNLVRTMPGQATRGCQIAHAIDQGRCARWLLCVRFQLEHGVQGKSEQQVATGDVTLPTPMLPRVSRQIVTRTSLPRWDRRTLRR